MSRARRNQCNGKSVGMESRVVGSPTSRDIDIDLATWSNLSIHLFSSNPRWEHHRRKQLTGEPIFSVASSCVSHRYPQCKSIVYQITSRTIPNFLAWCFGTIRSMRMKVESLPRTWYFVRSSLFRTIFFCVTRFAISLTLFLWLIIILSREITTGTILRLWSQGCQIAAFGMKSIFFNRTGSQFIFLPLHSKKKDELWTRADSLTKKEQTSRYQRPQFDILVWSTRRMPLIGNSIEHSQTRVARVKVCCRRIIVLLRQENSVEGRVFRSRY